MNLTLKLITICVSYVIQGSCDTVAAMTLLHIGWVTELNFLVSLFNEPSTALYSTTLSVLVTAVAMGTGLRFPVLFSAAAWSRTYHSRDLLVSCCFMREFRLIARSRPLSTSSRSSVRTDIDAFLVYIQSIWNKFAIRFYSGGRLALATEREASTASTTN